MSNLLAAVVAFGVMIFCHELGHFLVAKRVGITVNEFALGFGRRLAGFRRGGTLYAINALPFGGYVRMAGEDLDESSEPNSFRSKGVWERIAVVSAGPAMNLLLAALLLSVTAVAAGVPVGVSNRIGQLMPDMPAIKAGLRPGDAIVAINGVPMQDGRAVVETIHRHPNTALLLTIERDGRRLLVRVTSTLEPRQKIGLIGFLPEAIRERMDPARALAYGVTTAGQYTVAIPDVVVRLIRERRFFEQLAGPVAAVDMLGGAAQAGAEAFVYLAALFSIMIGIFNLLPIPALDGGRLLFLIVESVRRRPIDPKREGYIHLVGFALLLMLLVTLTIRDIVRLISRL